MKYYRTSEYIAYFTSSIEDVFRIVCDHTDVSWRSDLDHVEIMNEHKFIEYTKQLQKTEFTITEKQKNEVYAFTMENTMFLGKWKGIFTTENDQTKIIFTEYIHVKNPFMRMISYLFWDLKKIQRQYVKDLKKVLGET